ncbi:MULTISPECIES: FtsX-like permease family protein [Leuconostoc]|uniref:Probable ABC transporter, permease n=1 Tax=Leuconostoc kimchii (strain IMSNU 11154 / KCTC 2386 / IH25) TaxID=762051 RepID=D5T4A2_LEUKI|nr:MULTISPECIES: ABC transporter permease [Leuconostoc]ADG41040.1 probable ABC transporter, permease [Leuconostoc kimchii IMSNU 11154]AEJ30988.1 probable ABC transporter, permease [Leuconostoc sp. C2]
MRKIIKSLIMGQKTFMITIALLTLVSALTSMTILTAYRANISQYRSAYRTDKLPDVLVKVDNRDNVTNAIKSLKNVKNVTSKAGIVSQVMGKNDENVALFISNDVSNLNLKLPDNHKIVLSSYLKSNNNFKVGDTFEIGQQRLTVQGFYDDHLLGSPLFKYKQGTVSEETMQVLQSQKGQQKSQLALVNVFGKIKNNNKLLSDYPDRLQADLIYDKDYIQKAYTMLPTIVALVIILAAVFLFGICLFVMRFALLSGIDKDRQKIATFKTLGMTNRQVNLAYVMSYLGSNLVGLFGAVLVSFWTSNLAFKFFWQLNGLTGVQHVPINIIIVSIITLIMVSFSTIIILLSLRPVGSISPAAAFQGSQSKVISSSGHLKLTKSKMPLQITLAFKDYRQKIGHYMTFTLVISLFVFLSLMIMTLNQGFKGKINGLFGLPSVDLIMQTTNDTLRHESLQKINTITPIKSSGYNQETKILLSKDVIPVHRYSQIPDEIKVLSGHQPKQSKDLLLSSNLMKTLHLSVGQTVRVKTATNEQIQMTIVGTYQTINNLGKEAYSLIDIKLPMTTTYINLKKTSNKNSLLTRFSHKNVQLIDTSTSSKNLTMSIQRAVKALANIILLLTLIISGLFVYLVSYLTIETEKRQIALKKMLGFTNQALRIQYLLRAGFALMLGIVISLILNKFIGSALINSLVSLGGLTKLSVTLPLSYDVFIIALLVCESSLIVLVASQRITKIKIGDFL